MRLARCNGSGEFIACGACVDGDAAIAEQILYVCTAARRHAVSNSLDVQQFDRVKNALRSGGFAGVCGPPQRFFSSLRKRALKISRRKSGLVATEAHADDALVFALVGKRDVTKRFFFTEIAHHVDDE